LFKNITKCVHVTQSLTVELHGRVFRQLLFRNLGNGIFEVLLNFVGFALDTHGVVF